MKQTIYIKRINRNIAFPEIIDKGDWIDLHASKQISLKAPTYGEDEDCDNVVFDSALIPLGVAMKFPDGLEGHLLPRSSTFKHFGIIMSNHQGIIDGGKYGYNGNNDEWMINAIAFKKTIIDIGDRICQFRVCLSQKATLWQKIKWFFTNGIKLVEVDNLSNTDRNGFGSTGK